MSTKVDLTGAWCTFCGTQFGQSFPSAAEAGLILAAFGGTTGTSWTFSVRYPREHSRAMAGCTGPSSGVARFLDDKFAAESVITARLKVAPFQGCAAYCRVWLDDPEAGAPLML
jgi:hypothetical protein